MAAEPESSAVLRRAGIGANARGARMGWRFHGVGPALGRHGRDGFAPVRFAIRWRSRGPSFCFSLCRFATFRQPEPECAAVHAFVAGKPAFGLAVFHAAFVAIDLRQSRRRIRFERVQRHERRRQRP